MTETIGKVKLDYSKYPGEDLYCDGTVEDEILDIVKRLSPVEYAAAIEEKASWPVLYHLSPLRENIVDWLPIGKQDKVLEVGSGCGAVTGALARMAGSVICVDLSKKRSLINAYRHSECDNVTIHADEGSVAAQFSQKLAEQKSRDPLVTAAPVQTPTAVSRPDTQATTEPVSTATPAPAATPVPGNVLGSTIIVGNHALVMVHPCEEKVQQGYTEPEAGQETGEEQDITAETENGKIPEWMYYRNQSVGAVTIPEGTTEIGRFAFSRSSLRTVTIPEGVTVIDYAAFYHCDNLDNVVLPDTVNTVGAKAFTHTGWLDDFEENSMDDFLISGDILVAYKGNLPEVVIPDGVRVIAEEAFRNHTELKKVHLPASVTDIGNDAFPEGIEIINE